MQPSLCSEDLHQLVEKYTFLGEKHRETSTICNIVEPCLSSQLNVFSLSVSGSCLYFAKPLLSPACELAIVVTLNLSKANMVRLVQGKLMQCFVKYARRHRARLVHPNMFTHGHMSVYVQQEDRHYCNALSHLTDCHMGWPQTRGMLSRLSPMQMFIFPRTIWLSEIINSL